MIKLNIIMIKLNILNIIMIKLYSCVFVYSWMMTLHLRILSWALIFILRLRFPPSKSLVNITTKFVEAKGNMWTS